jgi:hypothetical protein
MSASARGEREGGREGGSASVRTHRRPRSRGHPRVDAPMHPHGHAHVRADASVLPPGNFITDAIVRLSHGRPSGHRPIVCLSVRYRLRDNLAKHMSNPAPP